MTPARIYAVTRIALGAWIFVAPMAFGGKWFAPPQDPVLTASIIRSVGGRDLAIGVASCSPTDLGRGSGSASSVTSWTPA